MSHVFESCFIVDKKNIIKWLSFLSLCLFAVATFQIVGEHFIVGAIAFGAAACAFSYAGRIKKLEKLEAQEDTGSK